MTDRDKSGPASEYLKGMRAAQDTAWQIYKHHGKDSVAYDVHEAIRVKADNHIDVFGDAEKTCQLIADLTTQESDEITILGANPAPGRGEPYLVAVVIRAHWTAWQANHFTGDTLLECLEGAVKAKEETAAAHTGDKVFCSCRGQLSPAAMCGEVVFSNSECTSKGPCEFKVPF